MTPPLTPKAYALEALLSQQAELHRLHQDARTLESKGQSASLARVREMLDQLSARQVRAWMAFGLGRYEDAVLALMREVT